MPTNAGKPTPGGQIAWHPVPGLGGVLAVAPVELPTGEVVDDQRDIGPDVGVDVAAPRGVHCLVYVGRGIGRINHHREGGVDMVACTACFDAQGRSGVAMPRLRGPAVPTVTPWARHYAAGG